MTDEVNEIGNAIREAQINQMLNGIIKMPHMLPRLKDMAARGDETAKEVVKQYEEYLASKDQEYG